MFRMTIPSRRSGAGRGRSPFAAAIAAFAAAGLGCGAGELGAQEAARSGSVAISVYNQNFALVKDMRSLDLTRGTQEVRIDDVAAFIDPTSVHFSALDHPGDVAVIEQNYKYDIADAEHLLSRYLNQEINVVLKEGGTREGRLLSYDGSEHKSTRL